MKSVIKGAGYILVHTPDMVIHNGTTQTTERIVNPESEYLKELPGHIRSFEDVLSYYPNQVYIGNVTPDELAEVPLVRQGMPQERPLRSVRSDDASGGVPSSHAGLRRV